MPEVRGVLGDGAGVGVWSDDGLVVHQEVGVEDEEALEIVLEVEAMAEAELSIVLGWADRKVEGVQALPLTDEQSPATRAVMADPREVSPSVGLPDSFVEEAPMSVEVPALTSTDPAPAPAQESVPVSATPRSPPLSPLPAEPSGGNAVLSEAVLPDGEASVVPVARVPGAVVPPVMRVPSVPAGGAGGEPVKAAEGGVEGVGRLPLVSMVGLRIRNEKGEVDYQNGMVLRAEGVVKVGGVERGWVSLKRARVMDDGRQAPYVVGGALMAVEEMWVREEDVEFVVTGRQMTGTRPRQG